MPTRIRSSSQHGFTLIELLTVIAIIAVLAAILFPVFSSARESARKANCLSNLQQIGTAMAIYANDHDGRIVPWCITHPNVMAPPASQNSPAPDIVTWDITIKGELRDTRVVSCKSNPLGGYTARAYAIARYTQRPFGTSFFGGHKDDIPAPTRTVLLFEKGSNLPGSWGDALGENAHQSHNSEGQPGYSEAMFHSRGKNFLYIDGHAKWDTEGQGPFANKPTPADEPGVLEVWGRPPNGDWPEAD